MSEQRATYYYSESKGDFVDVMSMEPHHARYALRKLLRDKLNSTGYQQESYTEGWNDAIDMMRKQLESEKRGTVR